MWIFSQNETGCVLGAFCGTSQRQQLSYSKTREASVACWFYQQAYHLALSTRDPQPATKRTKKRGEKTMCVARAVLMLTHNTNSYQKTSSHQELWNIQQSGSSCRKQSSHTAHFSLPLPLGIVIYFPKKEMKKTGPSQCQAYLTVCLSIRTAEKRS